MITDNSQAQNDLNLSKLLEKSKKDDSSRKEARDEFQKKYAETSFNVVGPFGNGNQAGSEIKQSGSYDFTLICKI